MEVNENTLGGAIWVNLLNTKRMVNGTLTDILDDRHLFIEWLKENELFLWGEEGEYIGQIDQLKVLREHFNAIVEKSSQGIPITDMPNIEKINSILASLPAILMASFNDDGIYMEVHACEDKNEWALQMIQSFLNTLKEYGMDRVRQCAHEECILHFLDISKSGKRKWCSMETCGNRKKAAKHYYRNKMTR